MTGVEPSHGHALDPQIVEDRKTVGVANRGKIVEITNQHVAVGEGGGVGVLDHGDTIEQAGDEVVHLAQFDAQPLQAGAACRRVTPAGKGARREQVREARVRIVKPVAQERAGPKL